jgi:hypothetical protein
MALLPPTWSALFIENVQGGLCLELRTMGMGEQLQTSMLQVRARESLAIKL